MIVDFKAFQIQHLFWWTRPVVLILLGCFFLIFGIHILVSSYKLEEPFSFILTFFASNFIILISLTLVIVFLYQMKAFVVSRDSERQDILDSKKIEEDRQDRQKINKKPLGIDFLPEKGYSCKSGGPVPAFFCSGFAIFLPIEAGPFFVFPPAWMR